MKIRLTLDDGAKKGFPEKIDVDFNLCNAIFPARCSTNLREGKNLNSGYQLTSNVPNCAKMRAKFAVVVVVARSDASKANDGFRWPDAFSSINP